MKYLSIGIFVLFSVIFFGCKEKPVSASAVPPATTAAPQPVASPQPFAPPADSVISGLQLKSWSACNPLLDSLTFKYADSFKTTDPSVLIRCQEDFITAQDRICVKAGLPGGYQEYKWILRNMGIEKNRAVLQQANAQTF